MANNLGGINGISLTFDINTEEGQKNVKGLTHALTEAEAAAKSAETAGQTFANVFTGIGKAATGAFAMITAILKAPVDLDNYMGNLNQKITQMDGNLNKYKNILLEFKTGAFKPGEGGFGLEDQDYKKLMMQFSTGTAAVEKYGAAAAANMKDFTGGAGMMMKTLGFSPEQAGLALTDLHKTAGLTFEKMEPFARQLGAIGKSANLSSTQMASLVGQVTKLSKAYGMGATQAQKFVLDSVQVGAAISQMGMNVQDTIAKMNQVSEGTEEGLIQSLLLGFKPGDAKGQLAAFQNQAKMIVAQAAGVGDQMAPFVIRQMADAMGMKNISNEAIQRLAGGGMIEGPKGAQQKDATDIVKEIAEQSKLLGKESPFVTTAQLGNAAINKLEGTVIRMFERMFSDFKSLLGGVPDFIDKAKKWFDTVHTFFGDFDLSLKNVALALMGFKLLPTFGKLLVSLVGWLSKGAAAGEAGAAASGLSSLASAAGNAAFGVARLSLWATALYEMFKSNKAGWDYDTNKGAQFYSPEETAARKKAGLPLTGEGLDLKMTTGQGISPAMSGRNKEITLKDAAGSDFQTTHGLASFLGGRVPASALSTKQNDPTAHLGQGHPERRAVDVDTSKLPGGNYGPAAEKLKSEAEAAGFWVNDERSKKGVRPHLHIEEKKAGTAAKLAQANTGAESVGSLQNVHDASANASLVEIKHYLMSLLQQQPAIAGSMSAPDPTSSDIGSALQGTWNQRPAY